MRCGEVRHSDIEAHRAMFAAVWDVHHEQITAGWLETWVRYNASPDTVLCEESYATAVRPERGGIATRWGIGR